jgi:chromosome segregation ATPase
MINLEQIKLLESKVVKAIDIVTRVTEENAYLKGKLETYQTRIEELEVLIQRFKEDQGLIEDGILSALDRLSQFEAAIEKSLTPAKQPEAKESRGDSKKAPAKPQVPSEEQPSPAPVDSAAEEEVSSPMAEETNSGGALMFEVSEEEEDSPEGEGGEVEIAELDIF